MAGAAGGAISSAVYGQNIEKGLAYGAIGGLTGMAVAAVASAAISFGANIIKELLPEDLVAGFGKSAHVTYKTRDAKGKIHTYKEKWYGKDISDNPFEKMLDNVIARNEEITFFEFVGHGLEGDIFYGEAMLGSNQIKQSAPLGFKGKILKAFSKHATIEIESCYSEYGADSVTQAFKDVLPKAQVFGYTGKAKPYWFIGCDWESFAWRESKWVEVK